MAEYKTNIQKSIVFPPYEQQTMQKWNYRNNSNYDTFKKNKIYRNKFNKKVQTENHKTVVKYIQKISIKGETPHDHVLET